MGWCYDAGMRGGRNYGVLLALLAALGASTAEPVWAYGGDAHQQLMFLAARQYNECVKDTPDRRLSALQVRYAARAAVGQAEASFVRRMFRWGFYEREEQSPKSTLWVVETRMHEHFNELTDQLANASSDADKFSVAGRIAAYVQDVTSPVRVVPIYTARFWRFNTSDRFDNFDLQVPRLESALADACEELFATPADTQPLAFSDILKETADKSLRAIVEPIPGMPTTWQAFWRLASDPGEFGEYGPAGNRFGNSASFRCAGERCVLLNDDPLYEEFATARHADAVLGTMRVLHVLQELRVGSTSEEAATSSRSAGATTLMRSAPELSPVETAEEDSPERAMARAQARTITANE